jgi:hypothetical protein
MPLTFHIVKGQSDPAWEELKAAMDFEKLVSKNIWIVKPGENSNRGRDIVVCNSLEQIKEIISR